VGTEVLVPDIHTIESIVGIGSYHVVREHKVQLKDYSSRKERAVRLTEKIHTELGDRHFVQNRVDKRVLCSSLLIPCAFWIDNARIEAVSVESQLGDTIPGEDNEETKGWLHKHLGSLKIVKTPQTHCWRATWEKGVVYASNYSDF
jgi:hypothetical protein